MSLSEYRMGFPSVPLVPKCRQQCSVSAPYRNPKTLQCRPQTRSEPAGAPVSISAYWFLGTVNRVFLSNSYNIEVPPVPTDEPRSVFATFIGYSHDDNEIYVWA